MPDFKLITACLLLICFRICSSENYGSTTVFVPYANAAKNENLARSPTINIGFNGAKHTPFVMDTGSVGIIASPDKFTPAPDAVNLGPGHIYYSSSGIIEEGTWWSASVQIYDLEGKVLATANVPVLQVTSTRCAENARNCKVRNDPKGICMMGVGFARESKEQPRGTPNYNPFLNISQILQGHQLKKLPFDWSSGYVVTKEGVYLGLTPKNTLGAVFIKLEEWVERSTKNHLEWKAAPMTIHVNGVSGNGTILMDTGVDTAYLSPPQNANIGPLNICSGANPETSRAECAPNGTSIHVYLPDDKKPVIHYSFTVGEKNNLMQPNGVHIVKRNKIFLNSSRHVLSKMSIIYDNSNGHMGYIFDDESKTLNLNKP